MTHLQGQAVTSLTPWPNAPAHHQKLLTSLHVINFPQDWTTVRTSNLTQYTVRQKSNETDFLLTMNLFFLQIEVIPFEIVPLGSYTAMEAVSIVRSSAGRLLLEYLSACWLSSSGYYPKYQNGALSSGFWAGGIKGSPGTEIRRIGGLRNHTNAFFCQKFIDGDCHVTWGIVVVQHPCVCNAWSHTCHPFPESFKDFPIKSMIDSLSWWHKFPADDPDCQKNKLASIWFWICSFSLSWDGESLQCDTPEFGVLSWGHTLKSLIHHLW